MITVQTMTDRKGQDWARHVTHCIYGHAYTPANTVHTAKGRACRECNRQRCREWRALA